MLQDQLSELRMKRPQIRGVGWWVCPAQHVRCPGHEVLLPVSDLGGMHPEVFGHFRQRLVASDRYQGDLRLKSCPVIPSRPFLTFPQFRGHRVTLIIYREPFDRRPPVRFRHHGI